MKLSAEQQKKQKHAYQFVMKSHDTDENDMADSPTTEKDSVCVTNDSHTDDDTVNSATTEKEPVHDPFPTCSFLVDSGSTSHTVNEDVGFIEYDESFVPTEHIIELADGSKTKSSAVKKGKISINITSENGDIVNAVLNDVLLCPSYPHCMFSVKQATSSDSQVYFAKQNSVLIAPNGVKFPIEHKNGLYWLKNTGSKTSLNSAREVQSDLQTWHRILGHCNVQDVKSLEGVVKGMKITDKSSFDCETCILAKQVNNTNKCSDNRATAPFELVFTDLAGPIEPIAKGGFQYAMIFTDSYTGCIFKKKSDAVEGMRKFFADIAPYGHVKRISFYDDVIPSGNVSKLRSDNGGEYLSKDLKNLLLQLQVKHEFTSPYSPHQNGIAERSWRTLFDMGRGLLIESGLPKVLWVYALMAATFIRNRCYNRRLKGTPYAAITGLKPDVSGMHIFWFCLLSSHTNIYQEIRCKKY